MRIATTVLAAALVLAGCNRTVETGSPSPANCDPSRGQCPSGGTPNTGQPPTSTPTNQPPTQTPPNPPAHR